MESLTSIALLIVGFIVVSLAIIILLAIACFESEEAEKSKKSSPGKRVFKVVRIYSPELNIEGGAAIPDQQIQSYSGESIAYDVSVAEMTCTCPDFIKHRKEFQVTDPRRACKHLYGIMEDNDMLSSQTELALAILEWRAKNQTLTTVKLSGGNEVAICHGGSDWVDVFSRRRKKGDSGGLYTGKYGCYGYRGGWSYGSAPPGAREIKSILSQVL